MVAFDLVAAGRMYGNSFVVTFSTFYSSLSFQRGGRPDGGPPLPVFVPMKASMYAKKQSRFELVTLDALLDATFGIGVIRGKIL